MTSSLEPRTNDAGLDRLKRRSYVVALLAASVAATVGYFHDASLDGYPVLRFVFGPLTTAGAAISPVLLGTERLALARAERVAYVASGTILVLRVGLGFALLDDEDSVLATMPNFSPWIGAVYIMAFAAFPTRRAVLMACALYVVLLAICVVFVATRGIATIPRQDLGGLLQEFLVAHPFVISLLYFMANVKEAHAKERIERVMLDRIAHTDELTGLANRRHVLGAAQKELDRIARTPVPFALLMIDVDHFKRVNDTHGHATGDEVLRGVAETLRQVVRAGDDVGRYGGEEFLVLAYGADASMAESAAERLRAAIADRTQVGLPRVTASVGVASHVPGESLAVLLSRADAALYVAKNEGRNRVAVSAA